MELSIPYVLTAVDGDRFVVGNSNAAKADLAWVGYLDPDGGITGLLDGAEGRASIVNIAQGHGVRIGPTWRGQRSGTIGGMLDPNVFGTPRELLAARIRRVLAKMEMVDGILTWTPSLDGITRRLRIRHVAARPDIRGRQPTTFLLALASPDALVQSAGAAGTLILLAGALTASGTVTNLGDVPAPVMLRFDGPFTAPPSATLVETAEAVVLNRTFTATQYALVDPENGLARLGDTAAGTLIDQPSMINFAATRVWRAPAGAHAVQLAAAAGSAGKLTVTIHHTWP